MMNNSYNTIIFYLFLMLILQFSNLFSQTSKSSKESALTTAEGIVAELYDLITIDAGTNPDWEKVKSLFIDEAVIVLRTSRDQTTIFSVSGFVEDFIKFLNEANIKETGFKEKIIRTETIIFGEIAHMLVLYEASIPNSGKSPQQGVDSIQLIKREKRWWIASITNEIPTPERPLPAVLLMTALIAGLSRQAMTNIAPIRSR